MAMLWIAHLFGLRDLRSVGNPASANAGLPHAATIAVRNRRTARPLDVRDLSAGLLIVASEVLIAAWGFAMVAAAAFAIAGPTP